MSMSDETETGPYSVGITQEYRTVENFNPGGGDPGVIRMVDGHRPWEGGIDGANVHHRGDVPEGEQGLPVSDC